MEDLQKIQLKTIPNAEGGVFVEKMGDYNCFNGAPRKKRPLTWREFFLALALVLILAGACLLYTVLDCYTTGRRLTSYCDGVARITVEQEEFGPVLQDPVAQRELTSEEVAQFQQALADTTAWKTGGGEILYGGSMYTFRGFDQEGTQVLFGRFYGDDHLLLQAWPDKTFSGKIVNTPAVDLLERWLAE